jgi:hydroxyethylthiazole kinase
LTIIDRAAATLEAIRARSPRIHCVTNDAAHVLTANMLLAIGALPSLTSAREEVGDFVRSADGLLINLGTLDPVRLSAIDVAVEAARQADVPWLLDPVFCDRSSTRARLAGELAGRRPAIVRANAKEFEVLAQRLGVVSPEDFASRTGTVMVRSGAQDLVTDGTHRALVDNGHGLMDRSTAIGCAGTAVMAAFAAIDGEPYEAAVSGMLAMGVAGEIAGERSPGPGSFAVNLVDALYQLDGAQLRERARIS